MGSDYIKLQGSLWKKYDLVKKLNIKNFKERCKVNSFLSALCKDKKITTETESVKQLKDVEKFISNHFDEFKKRFESYTPKPKKSKK